ncbi:hypothetical protein AMS68_003429 [Peltaster fructicola]|uniref:Holocytochrome c-type synthase n=1 Tax=Peltaster fructicola TaxID=286661 RepID=A0A6H0XT11_9PEZI|nr:hypothetical protein AMS68_003429 [Peltaster fructicola]
MSADAEKCPVDHQTREKWLEAARAKGQRPPAATSSPQPYASAWRFSLDYGHWENHGRTCASLGRTMASPPGKRAAISKKLRNEREVSTIPRAVVQAQDKPLNEAERAALPANSEGESGHDTQSGNWVYPSQEMFFNAMRRKGHEAKREDMSSIVPIHNAVNERAWAEIKMWEAGQGSEKCGGPKLVSFSGDSKALTPKARWNQLVGYNPPFDRHDWVVDRCGKRIDYVIDFYSGKGGQGLNGLNFYLDVRPKLNTWEGIRLRASKAIGL